MWRYIQSSGILTSQAGTNVASGYSGFGLGRNNPTIQNIANTGPIPVGFYHIEFVGDTPNHGPYVLRLEPFKDNVMFGRSGFLMHGDSVSHMESASHGCIIMPRPVRELVWTSSDHQLEVAQG
jgi:hypothetical protein